MSPENAAVIYLLLAQTRRHLKSRARMRNEVVLVANIDLSLDNKDTCGAAHAPSCKYRIYHGRQTHTTQSFYLQNADTHIHLLKSH